MLQKHIHLHPIMFLLNPAVLGSDLFVCLHLHPIMFLLNRRHQPAPGSFRMPFTSHYVPIKSLSFVLQMQRSDSFTSHYVPIKSAICVFVA